MNGRAEIRQAIAGMSKGAYVILGGLGLVAAVLIYLRSRLLG